MSAGIIVAISSDFFTSVLKLPKTQQDKAVKLIEKFRQNPTSPGANYETINAARDKNVRSLRIDQAYRAIVLAPTNGNVYILLWADKHDDAYTWARNKIFKVNPENGALQIINTDHIAEAEKLREKPPPEIQGLFDSIRNRHLVRIGVPEELLPLVHRVGNLDDLEELAEKLPNEAYEALALIADGETIDDVLEAYDVTLQDAPSGVNTDDFASALDNPDSQRRFMLASDDEALQAMLDAPLEKWRVFLHPLQRKLVERDWSGPVRVLGGAGTGKTVVAMHRAKWLAENLDTTSGGRILFTTFTRNLAGDIERNLSSICRPEQMRKIDVINLDAWVKRFLEKHGYKVNFAFNEAVKEEIWGRALVLKPDTPALPDTFFKEEWEKVIQPQNVSTMEEYFRARRTGRGVRLNRAYRKVIWLVFENYRLGLNDAGLKEPEDAYRDAVTLISSKQIQVPYSSVIVDEAQDFGANAYRLLRAMVKEGTNDVFIVGDAHQRIYGRKVVLGQCGIKIVGRSRKLRVNYRTTEQIRRWAVALLHGIPVDDLDDGIDEQKGYRSLMKGPEPEVRVFSGMEEEIEFLATSLGQISDEASSSICVVARRQSDVDRYLSGLGSKGMVLHKISRSVSDDSTQPGIRIATMHRIKGLEFESVYIVGANKGIMPLDVLDTEDVTVVREHEWREKSLLYVAATRAKQYCSISSFGAPSPFLAGSVAK